MKNNKLVKKENKQVNIKVKKQKDGRMSNRARQTKEK